MTRKKQQPQSTSIPSRAASPAARRQAAAILEVLAGVRRPMEAATLLSITLPRYYQLERRALEGLVRACEVVPRGPQPSPDRRLAQLERENGRLRRECDRQQALVRAAERALGIAPHARCVAGFLTIPQLAKKLGVSRWWISDRLANGTIKMEQDEKAKCYLFPDTPATFAELSELVHEYRQKQPNLGGGRGHQDA